jgi:galactose mutarotase-like enzyme
VDVHLDALDLGPGATYAKVLAGPLAEGRAAVVAQDGQALEVRWPVREHPWCGLWLTRGGFQGQHTVALEPTNLPCDSLAQAGDRAAVLTPGATATWWVEVRLTPPGG